jgi:hypothetical protein
VTVEEAVEALLEYPLDADLAICGHEFPGMADDGWFVIGFEPTTDGQMVMIEGAQPPDTILTGRDVGATGA